MEIKIPTSLSNLKEVIQLVNLLSDAPQARNEVESPRKKGLFLFVAIDML